MVEPKYYLETDGSMRPGERRKSGDSPSVGGAGIVLWDPELRMVLAESVRLGPISCGPEAELRAVPRGAPTRQGAEDSSAFAFAQIVSPSFVISPGRRNSKRSGLHRSKRRFASFLAASPL